MLCSPTEQKGFENNAFQTSTIFWFSVSWKGQPCSCMSEYSSVLSLAVFGGLMVTTQEWIPHTRRGRSPVFCSLDPADTALPDLRSGRMIGIFWDHKLDIRGKSANKVSSEENMQCLNCTVDIEQLCVVNE